MCLLQKGQGLGGREREKIQHSDPEILIFGEHGFRVFKTNQSLSNLSSGLSHLADIHSDS